MVVTCASSGSGQLQGHTPEADECSDIDISVSPSDDIFTSISPQDPSLFQTRQALGKYIYYIWSMPANAAAICLLFMIGFPAYMLAVTYLQHNTGGITLFGFALDRGLLHTLFASEFSLVLWILSKVVVLSWTN